MNSVGLGNLKSTTEGAVFAFDTLYNVGTVRPYSGYQLSTTNGTSFGMATTLASHWGRPINDMNSALIAPKLFVVNKDNATAHLIQPAWSKPATTTNYIGGDLYLNAPYYYGSEKNDVLGWRVSPGYNDMKWTTLKVDNEINFTTTDATNNYLEFHTAIPTLFRYIIDITCSDNSGHYWTEHRIITIGVNAGLPFIKDDQYENRIRDIQLNTASVDVICDNASNLITLKASGIAATNLNWKLQIKRINL